MVPRNKKKTFNLRNRIPSTMFAHFWTVNRPCSFFKTITRSVFEFCKGTMLFRDATRGGDVFFALAPASRALPQTRRKINITPEPGPHAELPSKLNTTHPLPYYVTRIKRDSYTSVRPYVTTLVNAPITRPKMADWRLTFRREKWRLEAIMVTGWYHWFYLGFLIYWCRWNCGRLK